MSGTGSPWRRVHHEVDPGAGGLVDARGELDALAAEAFLEDLGEAFADGGVVAVAGQVDQHRDVAAVGVAAGEEPQLAALPGVHDRLRGRRELVGRGVEQLVAGIVLQGVHQGLARVAARVEADLVHDLADLVAQERDPAQRLGVGGAGEESEEALLPHHLALGVERLDADVVEVRRTVHGGARVGLGQDQQGLLAGLARGPGTAACRTTPTCPGRRAGCPARCPGRHAAPGPRPPPRGGTRGSRGR